MPNKEQHKTYSAEFKLQVVLESLQATRTLESVCEEFQVAQALVYRWRQELWANAPLLFGDKRSPVQKALSQGHQPGESPDDLKKQIRELTTQNAILKKVSGLLGR